MEDIRTLHDILSNSRTIPTAPALVVTHNGPSCTHSELYAAVVDVALGLRRAGIRPGDVVSMAYANTVGCT
jgi:acyl-CoA synthetase (AMP-forming)/AMP-acid ligase II